MGARRTIAPSSDGSGKRGDAPAPETAHLRLLDAFGLDCGRSEIRLPLGAQRLVAFLALHPGAVTRQYVAGSLWLDVSDDRASANLRSALWRLHSAPARIVETTRTHVRLDPAVTVDHRDAVHVARRILDPTAELDETALAINPGELLPDWYDDWVTIERERFRFLRLNALERLCLILADRGRLGEAVDAGLSVVAAEPLRETAHRALVRAHLAAGNWWDALRQYESYKTLLAQQLGLPPSSEMEALILPIRRQRNTPATHVPIGRSPG
jgi:DNA-binding SARP family transcriptional activator